MLYNTSLLYTHLVHPYTEVELGGWTTAFENQILPE